MKDNNAIYGGEVSGHHYYKDFGFCESGILTWLVIWTIFSKFDCKVSEICKNYALGLPFKLDININVLNPSTCISLVYEKYKKAATQIDFLDGLTMNFNDWYFNLRSSNTETLLRLKVCSNRSQKL